ncbi:hypothetical protein HAX54_037843 [Datura stramonium]|uniref:Uncharacterized protein n=1 Tax=Datura stramonium TaxID=4076 RepID=A0ABS8VM52_DATST|nr:hypothetical protein [Datura stramonium]
MSAQKKRNFQIEAFKHRVVVDPKYAEKNGRSLSMQFMRFTIITPVVLVLKSSIGSDTTLGEPHPKDPGNRAIRNAYNMVLHKFGEKLWPGLVSTDITFEIANSIETAQGGLFLEELNRKWAEHNKALQTVEMYIDVLQYTKKTLKAFVMSSDFCRLESQQFIECCDCGDYLKKAEKRLNEEI